MKKATSLRTYGIVAAAVGAVLAYSPMAAAGEVKIGSLSAMTGPIPDLVKVMVEAEMAAVDQINKNGGLFGGDDIALVIGDSQCDAKAAVDAANKLVNVEQVSAIAGGICSGGTIGATEAVTIPAGVVSVSPSATSPAITDLDDNGLVYRTAPSDAYQGVALAALAKSMGYNSLAVTYANDDYNAALARVFMDAFKAGGGTIVAEQMHEDKKASYRSELATLSSAGGDALALFAYYAGSGMTIMRQSLENDFFGKFIGADGMLAQEVIDELGADSLRGNVVFTAATSDFGSGSYKDFADIFSATGGDPKAPYATQSYDAVMLLALALQHAGGATRDLKASLNAVAGPPGIKVGPADWAKAKAALEAGNDIDYDGAAGTLDFDANGDVGGLYGMNVVGDDGKWSQTLIE